MTESEILLDISDVGRKLKIPVKTIRNKLSDGSWPLTPIRIGRSLRWRNSAVESLMRGENSDDNVQDLLKNQSA